MVTLPVVVLMIREARRFEIEMKSITSMFWCTIKPTPPCPLVAGVVKKEYLPSVSPKSVGQSVSWMARMWMFRNARSSARASRFNLLEIPRTFKVPMSVCFCVAFISCLEFLKKVFLKKVFLIR